MGTARSTGGVGQRIRQNMNRVGFHARFRAEYEGSNMEQTVVDMIVGHSSIIRESDAIFPSGEWHFSLSPGVTPKRRRGRSILNLAIDGTRGRRFALLVGGVPHMSL